MSGKAVQMSVRISDDDAAFLARTQIDGAVTPSDKLRAIIAEARRMREEVQDYASCIKLVRDWLSPALERWREAERQVSARSEIMQVATEWLTETLAFVMSSTTKAEAGSPRAAELRSQLSTLERGVADRVFNLFQNVLRMGVTQSSPNYDPALVRARLGPVLELAAIIEAVQKKGAGK